MATWRTPSIEPDPDATARVTGDLVLAGGVWEQPADLTAALLSAPSLAPAADDPLRDWLDRCFDLYGGLGRHPGLFDLFGLEQREGDPELYSKLGPWGGLEKRNTGPESTRTETEFLQGKRD